MARTRGMKKKAKSGSKPQAGRVRVGKAASCKSIKRKSTTRAVASRLCFTPKSTKAACSGSGTTSSSSRESDGEPSLIRKPAVQPYSVQGNPPPRPRPRRSFSAYASRFEQHSPSPGARRSQSRMSQVPIGLDPDDEASVSAKSHLATPPPSHTHNLICSIPESNTASSALIKPVSLPFTVYTNELTTNSMSRHTPTSYVHLAWSLPLGTPAGLPPCT